MRPSSASALAVLLLGALLGAPVATARADDDLPRLLEELSAPETEVAAAEALVARLLSKDLDRETLEDRANDVGFDGIPPLITRTLEDIAILGEEARAAAPAIGFWLTYAEVRTLSTADLILRLSVPDAERRAAVQTTDTSARAAVAAFLGARGDETSAQALTDLAGAGPAAHVALLEQLAVRDGVLATVRAIVALDLRIAVPHLAAIAIDAEDPARTVARSAIESLVGSALPTPSAEGEDEEAVLAWWKERRSEHEVGLRHLVRHAYGALASGRCRGTRALRIARSLGSLVEHTIEPELVASDDPDLNDVDTADIGRVVPWALDEMSRWPPLQAPPYFSSRGALGVLRTAEGYDGPATGAGGEVSGLRRASMSAFAGMSPERIEQLTEDASPIVRLYAVHALLDREGASERALAALVRTARQPGNVVAGFGCCFGPAPLGDVILQDLPGRSGLALRVIETLIDEQLAPPSLTWLIREHPPGPERRAPLRSMVARGFPQALPVIAGWQADEDVEFLVAAIAPGPDGELPPDDAFEAVTIHTGVDAHARLVALVPAVLERFRRDEGWSTEAFLTALLSCSEDRADAALRRLVAEVDEATAPRLAAVMGSVLSRHGAESFVDLRWKLWEGWPWNPAATQAFIGTHRDARALRLARRDLAALPRRPGTRAMRARLDLVRRKDRREAAAWVVNELGDAPYDLTGTLARAVAPWREPMLVDSLLGAVERIDNTYGFVPVIRALLMFDSPEVDERIEHAVANHRHLQERWGGEWVATLLAERPRTWEDGEQR